MKALLIKPSGVIAPYVMEGYHKAFIKLGHEVIVADGSKDEFVKFDLLQIIEAKFDLVIGYGLTGLSLQFYLIKSSNIRIPIICLHYDNPYFHISSASEEIFSLLHDQYTYHFVWDSRFKDLMTCSGFKNVYDTMLAVDTDFFYPETTRPTNTIGIVSSFNKYEAMKIKSTDENVNFFIDTVIDLKIKNIGIPVLDIMDGLFSNKQHSAFANVKLMMEENFLGFWSEIYFKIHGKGTPIVRDYFARCVDGITVHIYGNTMIEKNNIICHSPVSYDTELRKVYGNHKVILNIASLQLESSLNNRVFDVFAAGGYVLSDYKKDMEIIFPNHYKEITFNNPDEFGSIADYYLSHDYERKELIKDLRELILANHTYKNRVQSIINLVMSSLSQEKFKAHLAEDKTMDNSVTITTKGQNITFSQQEITEIFHCMYYNSRVWENTYWCGHRILKCPTDMWIYQEMFWSIKPNYVIEAGTFRGGSALYMANLFDIMGKGRVISIDITEMPGRPVHGRITYLAGSSSDPEIARKVKNIIGKNKKIIVILDSDHSKNHVLDEMRLWWEMVNIGSYLIVEDSNLNGHPIRPDFGPGPMEAIADFLNENDCFQIDYTKEKFFMTQNSSGYLKRIK